MYPPLVDTGTLL